MSSGGGDAKLFARVGLFRLRYPPLPVILMLARLLSPPPPLLRFGRYTAGLELDTSLDSYSASYVNAFAIKLLQRPSAYSCAGALVAFFTTGP